ncbi:MAG: DNA-processing protein DprA [Pseudomonadota bacterium]
MQEQVNRIRNPDVLSEEQRLDWLQLIRSPHVGPAGFRELVNHFGSARDALAALPDLIARMGPVGRRHGRSGRGRRNRVAPRAEIEAEYETALKMGARLVAPGEPGYPLWLAETEGGPPLLYIMGNAALAERPIVAIVGSREASAAGRALAEEMGRDFGAAGFVVASGLARGIDGAAHRASLERGTLAVVAGGIDAIYPAEHAELHHAVAERGLLITEMPPGHTPRAKDFPRRNRIVSGVAQGVVVIEAARRSGTLITARLASEQGRQVFAVPGHPLDPRADGTNMLLRTGATLATRAEDVIEALAPLDPRANAPRLAASWVATCDHPTHEPLGQTEIETEGDDLFSASQRTEDNSTVHAPARTHRRSGMEEAVHTLRPFADLDRAHSAIGISRVSAKPDPRTTQPHPRDQLLSALGTTPVAIDTLCRVTELTTPQVRSALTELDLDGRIERHHNQLVSLRRCASPDTDTTHSISPATAATDAPDLVA